MNSLNPLDPMLLAGYDPYKGLSDQERIAAGIIHVVFLVVSFLVGILLCALLSGCTTTKYVPVPETHTEHHWHTDTLRQTDSIINDRTTIIREVDSATMAQYGIQLQGMQSAWLIQQRDLERRIEQLMQHTATSDTIRDSIPVPYPVVKEVPVEKHLSWWQQARLWLGNIVLLVIVAYVALWICKYTLIEK